MTIAATEALSGGLALHQSGQIAEAEARYGEALEAEPANADAWHLLGHTAMARGDWKSAAARVLQAIRCRPEIAAFHSTLGDILAAQNQQAQASQCYRKALRLDPRFVPALVNLGNALQFQGLYREACVEYWKAIQAQPECAEAFSNLGNSLRALGMNGEALDCYREALRLLPRSPEVAVNAAAANLCAGQYAEAEEWARQALSWQPGLTEALSNLSLALLNQGRMAEAELTARDAVEQAPEAAHLYSNLGSTMLHQKRFAEAEAAYRRAMELRPGYPEAMNNLGLVMRGQDRLEEAHQLFEQVVLRQPGYAEAWTNWGTVWQARNEQEQALACFDKALRLQPDHPKSHLCRAFSMLAGGRFTEGFAEYEWRWKVLGDAPRAALAKPPWDGGALGGRTILLYSEQGLGDSLQFSRFAPLVAARGGRVIIECQPAAVELLRSVEGVAAVASTAGPLPDFDVQCALMSLPGVLGTRVESIPGRTPYVSASPSWTGRLRCAMGPARGLRIGIAWAGNPLHGSDRLRSIPLEQLYPLIGIPGTEWFSLHIGEEARAEADRCCGLRQVLTDDGGLPELAGLMTCLDLILTVDTMPAHLAGALDRPVWTMLCAAPDWRWQLDAERTPWYPSMRLFRQTAPGDWGPVVEQVSSGIRQMIVQGSRSGSDMDE